MYSKKQIVKSLKDIEIRRNDSVYLSSSFGLLGLPEFQIKGINNLCKIFFELIFDLIGEKGTLFAPTFSYSFSQKKNINKNIFDINKTASTVGPFGEYLRNIKGSNRSMDPMISISGYGSMSEILNFQEKTSYGNGCMFEKLTLIKNLKILNIGVGPNYIPFIHYVDFKVNCNHRFNKYFHGHIINKKNKNFVKWHYPVAYKKKWAIADGHKLANKAMNKLILKSSLGDGNIYSSDYNKLLKFCIKTAKKDPWITAVGKYEKDKN